MMVAVILIVMQPPVHWDPEVVRDVTAALRPVQTWLGRPLYPWHGQSGQYFPLFFFLKKNYIRGMVNQVNIFLFKLGGKICPSENIGLRNFGTQVGQAMDDAITSEVTKHFDNEDENLYGDDMSR